VSLDAVQEKFTHGQVVDVQAKENHVVFHKESGALNSEWLVVKATPARTLNVNNQVLVSQIFLFDLMI